MKRLIITAHVVAAVALNLSASIAAEQMSEERVRLSAALEEVVAQCDGFNGQMRSRAANLAGDNALLRMENQRLQERLKALEEKLGVP